MPRSVVVGLHGSRESTVAADWAAREAARRGVSLRAVHIQDAQPYSYEPFMNVVGPRSAADERLPEWIIDELRMRRPEVHITLEEIVGQPAVTLEEVSEEAELLVLGSPALDGQAGFLTGHVSLATLSRAIQPVVLVRACRTEEEEHALDTSGLPSTMTPFQEVVLGHDLTRSGSDLIDFAFDSASRRRTVLRIIHGWYPPPTLGSSAEDLALGRGEDLAAQVTRELDNTLLPWREKYPDVDVLAAASVGNPARRLVQAAANAGLLIVGRRARHKPHGAHVGHVAQAVLHHAPCPVAVVPHD